MDKNRRSIAKGFAGLVGAIIGLANPVTSQVVYLAKEGIKKYVLIKEGENLIEDVFTRGKLVNAKLLDAIKKWNPTESGLLQEKMVKEDHIK